MNFYKVIKSGAKEEVLLARSFPLKMWLFFKYNCYEAVTALKN